MGGIDRAEEVPGLWGMESPGVLPSEVSCLRPRTDRKGFNGAAWRVTRVSKKCLRAARAWFLVQLSPGSSSIKRPARPGETPRTHFIEDYIQAEKQRSKRNSYS